MVNLRIAWNLLNVFEVLTSALIGYKPSFIGVVTCRKLEHAVALF